MTALAKTPLMSRLIRPDQAVGHVVLENVSWELYEQMLECIGDGRTKLVFDDGVLEIEKPNIEHEHLSRFLFSLIQLCCDHHGIPLLPSGGTTFRKKKKRGGLEPDESFYIQHYAEVSHILSTRPFVPQRDPPPDLAIEIDITNLSLNKLAVYARLGIPEVWRVTVDGLECLVLNEAGEYDRADQSPALPGFDLRWIIEMLQAGLASDPAKAGQVLREKMKG